MAIDLDQVQRFAALFPEGNVPRFPQHADDLASLNMTQQARVQSAMPDLWQQLHSSNENQLPADVLARMHRNELRAGDEVHLRQAGLAAAAAKLEADVREGEIQAAFGRLQAESEARAERAAAVKAGASQSKIDSLNFHAQQLRRSSGLV